MEKDFDAFAEVLKNAQKMQESFRHAYQEVANKKKEFVVSGKAGGDLVIAQVNSLMQLQDLELKPALFAEKQEVIQELIVAAVNQALKAAQETMKQEWMEISKKMGFASQWTDKGE